MKGYLAVTDLDWFDFLSGRADYEVNFWKPSAGSFKVLTEGEPLLFRLKSPRNRIGGYGFFERFSILPDWLAWQTFGAGNGAPTFEAFSARLGAIRSRNSIAGPRLVGCVVTYADGGSHDVDNGILLRADLHKLFDRGYVTVSDDHRFLVSPRLRGDFDNGRVYYELSGQSLHLPREPGLRPSPEALEWHRDCCYLG